jgi:hypothetical protein
MKCVSNYALNSPRTGILNLCPLLPIWLRCSAGILLTCLAASAANWYVDGRATGANNGTDWANAWPALTNINWTAIQPGDTLYLSGGTEGQTYPDPMVIAKDGTEANPITIRVSREAGHNGLVTIDTYSTAITMRDWVTINGAKDDTYAATWITNTVNVPLITNNIGLRIIGAHGVNYTRTGPAGMKLYWLEISTKENEANRHGIRIANAPPYNVTNTEIAYCWIHDVAQDGINHPGGTANAGWDRFMVHHCLIERTGDDGLEVGSGWTVHHSILRTTLHLRGHPDGIQSVGNYQRYYNNIFEDWSSSSFITQGVGTNYGPLQIYGNLVQVRNHPASATAIELKWYPIEANAYENTYWRDWVFANNTIANSGNGSLSTAKRYFCTNAFFREMLFANNIIVHSTNYVGGITYGSDGGAGGTWWDYSDVVFDYNVVAGMNTDISYKGIRANAEAVNAASGYASNASALPTFVDAATLDFRLAEADTVARGTGTNLTVLNLPGFDRDLYGNLRGESRKWDRGALVYGAEGDLPPVLDPPGPPPVSDANLLVWLTFDDSFENKNYLADQSGIGNHAWRFGRPDYPTNWPTRVAASSTPGGRPGMGYAGDFLWYLNDGWGLYNKSGDYAGITNTGGLASMTNATIALWARYHPASRVSPELTWAAEQNATLLSAGSTVGYWGSWDFGRFAYGGGNNTKFQVYTANPNHTQGRYLVPFPDSAQSGSGTTTNWNHYVVTWDNGVVRGYFNGVLFHTGTVRKADEEVITTLIIAQNHPNIVKWIGVGCNTHGGTPPLEDEPGVDYPNHGWFNGVMDDVRIYGRILSAAEVQALYSGTPSDLTAPRPPSSLSIVAN